MTLFAGDAWFDPIEAELRERVRQFLEEMIEQERRRRWDAAGTSAARLQAVGMERGRGDCLARSVLGVVRDGQKILLTVRNMGGESEAAWRGVLDDLVARAGCGRRTS